MSTRLEQRRLALTAATTIVYPFHAPGTLFTNRGAGGSVTATLPAPNAALIGCWYEFRVHANQSFIVAAASANTLVAPGDVAADNVGFQVSNKKIGRGLIVKCDGTQWYATPQAFDGFCIDGTEVAPSFATGTALVAPAITGAATIASGAVITTPTIAETTSTGTATGATGGAGLALSTVTPQNVAATGASGAGIDLPGGATGAVGARYKIVNMMTGVLNIYAVGGTINGTTGTTAFALSATGNRTVDVFSVAAGVWIARGNT